MISFALHFGVMGCRESRTGQSLLIGQGERKELPLLYADMDLVRSVGGALYVPSDSVRLARASQAKSGAEMYQTVSADPSADRSQQNGPSKANPGDTPSLA